MIDVDPALTRAPDAAEALTGRLFDAVLGAFDLVGIALGDRLGYYRVLCELPGIDAARLAARTGTHPRYAREWLEQQAATGLVLTDGRDAWELAPGVQQVLVDRDDPRHLAPLARQLAAVAGRVPQIAAGVRTGRGLSWADFGPEMRESEADLNRAGFLGPLGADWLPSIPEVHDRLQEGARVADIGCGEAWSSIGIAKAYPLVTVDAFDADGPSIDRARRHVYAAGLADRVRLHCADVAEVARAGRYDVVTAFECLHDLAFPVRALAAVQRALDDDGVLLVADMRTGASPTFPADRTERLLYGFSVGVCLPDAMATPGSAMTGTVMRPDVLESYAREAGFTALEDAAVEHDLWRFTVLRP